jgi:glutamine amidotransferase-like uncharacterized protein
MLLINSSQPSDSSYLSDCLSQIVKEINALEMTIYSYTGNEKHEPIYYEEIGLFQKLLKEAGITYSVIEVSDAEFFPQNWDPKHSIIHIPGAKSSDLDLHIGDKVEAIKAFVNKGGRFIGWCGGGYWACHEVQYRMSEELTFNKVRALDLWKGIEKGPFLPFPGQYTGSIEYFHGAVKIKWEGSDILKRFLPDGVQVNVLLSGGGSFIPAKEEHKYKVLAFYENIEHDRSLAGVKTYVGNGIAILINPYFTYGADYLRAGLEAYEKHFPQHNWSKIYSELKDQELKSMVCFADMLLEAIKD